MRMRNGWIGVCLAVVGLSCAVAGAQTQPAGGLKVGYLDIDDIVREYKHTESTFKELEVEYAAEQTKLNNMEKDIKALNDELETMQKAAGMASDAKKQEIETKKATLVQKTQEYVKYGRERSRILERKKDALIAAVLKVVNQAVDQVAKNGKYDLIFKESFLAFSNPSLDVTTQVVKALNELPPPDVKAALAEAEAAAAKSAAARESVKTK